MLLGQSSVRRWWEDQSHYLVAPAVELAFVVEGSLMSAQLGLKKKIFTKKAFIQNIFRYIHSFLKIRSFLAKESIFQILCSFTLSRINCMILNILRREIIFVFLNPNST